MTAVTQAYLDGIREGHETMKLHIAADEPIDPKRILASLEAFHDRVGRAAYSAEQIDFVRGEIDFWKAQVTKL